MTCIAELLAVARQTIPAAEARLLLSRILDQTPVWLVTHDDFVLDEITCAKFQTLVKRRSLGEPVAYLLGRREFFGREFTVSPAVLIPRPETELLIDIALERIDAYFKAIHGSRCRVLELGTGSGCIAISLALERPLRVDVVAVDASTCALEVALQNADQLGASVRYFESDWFGALGQQRFDLIISNPPYIAHDDPHLGQGDLRFEPMSALIGGADGLSALRKIVGEVPQFLNPGGEVWLEHGYDQAAAVRSLLTASGFAEIEQHEDIAGILRVSGGLLSNR